MTRLLTDEQLGVMAIPPWVTIVDALDAGDSGALAAALDPFECALNAQVDRYDAWAADLLDFARDTWGRDGLHALHNATRRFLAASPDVSEATVRPRSIAAELAEMLAVAGPDRAKALLDARLTEWKRLIDFLRDWISAELSEIYRRGGPDELESALRWCGACGLMGALAAWTDRPAVERLASFVELLHGHFTELTLEEDDRRFVIRQHVCGTCARQVSDGRYNSESEMGLELVTDDHAVTWGGRPTTIYRTHIPIWHVLMAREAIGVPWPVNQCPAGLDAGTCTILLYKDPFDSEANEVVPGALGRSR